MQQRLSDFSIKAEIIERHLEMLDMGLKGTEKWSAKDKEAHDTERQMLVLRLGLNNKPISELFKMLEK